MKLAVTGASGFAGSYVMGALDPARFQVRALVRKPSAPMPCVNWVRGDLSQPEALDALCGGADCVLHIAGAISAPSRAEFFQVNVQGTANVLAAAQRSGVKRFVYISSLAAREPAISHYAASKCEAESLVTSAGRDMACLIIRPCAVYGEGDKATLPLLKMLLSSIALIPGTPQAQFSMVHAADLARMLVETVTSDVTGLLEVDDGAGGYRWADLALVTRRHFGTPRRMVHIPKPVARAAAAAAELAGWLSGKSPMLSKGSVDQLYGDNWVAAAPGWPLASPLTLERGLLRAIAGYQSMGLLPKQPPLATPPQDFET